MYKYETHLHTFPVSTCGKADVYETLDFYKKMGYDGVFITNHFIDGNLNIDFNAPYEEKIEFYFSDYEKGVEYGKKLGLKVFCGVEMSYKGTDFLVYGLDKEWFLKNPRIANMKKTEELKYLMENGALVVQAHPFREAGYIDHIRLFPRSVHGVEVINATRDEFVNNMAKIYADQYKLLHFAGSDNHFGASPKRLAGMESETPVVSVQDFVNRILEDSMSIFTIDMN